MMALYNRLPIHIFHCRNTVSVLLRHVKDAHLENGAVRDISLDRLTPLSFSVPTLRGKARPGFDRDESWPILQDHRYVLSYPASDLLSDHIFTPGQCWRQLTFNEECFWEVKPDSCWWNKARHHGSLALVGGWSGLYILFVVLSIYAP